MYLLSLSVQMSEAKPQNQLSKNLMYRISLVKTLQYNVTSRTHSTHTGKGWLRHENLVKNATNEWAQMEHDPVLLGVWFTNASIETPTKVTSSALYAHVT